jgi:hypothetical protein
VELEVDGVTKQLEKLNLRPFHYSHQGSLAWVSLLGMVWTAMRQDAD